MPAPKSLLSGKLTVDQAKKAHNCQHVASHRIQRGDKRLKVPKGRSFEHFCLACALKTIESDIAKLKALASTLSADG